MIMGLFNYEKEGPGVSKDAPKKKGVFLFFELLGRKIGKFVQINMLYFIASLPMIAVSFLLGSFFARYVGNIIGVDLSQNLLILTMASMFFCVCFVVFIGSGPASAALANFNRCAIREEHTYVAADFCEVYRKNFKQSMIVSVLNPLVASGLIFSVIFYGVQYMMTGGFFWLAAMSITSIVLAVFVGACFYIYQLMITFENTVFELYKNAVILSLMSLPQNVLYIIIVMALSYFVFMSLTPIVSLIIAFLLWISVMRFVVEFGAARKIKSKLLDK